MERPRPVKMDPQPLGAVDGKWTSDSAKANVRSELEKLGYVVRSVNASPEQKLIAYVDQEKRPERPPRSSKAKPVLS